MSSSPCLLHSYLYQQQLSEFRDKYFRLIYFSVSVLVCMGPLGGQERMWISWIRSLRELPDVGARTNSGPSLLEDGQCTHKHQ